ncbi:MAG TPA: tetratricopeptide repeat protein, partial [Phaeodactylibacter sp.]|nr:tetratricopeptide repeat protein [Phaeodactylibacter sp.]
MKMNIRLAALAAGLCLANLLMPAQSFAQPLTHAYLRTADKAYAQNDWTLAEENYRKAIFHDTTTYATDSSRLQQYLPRELYNLGNALYLQQRYQEALKAYQNAFQNGSDKLQTQALFNLGNTFYALGKYEEAAEAFKEVLRRQPGYPDAAYNLAQSLRKLKEQQQKQEQEQQDEQQDKEQQEQQDEQQQDEEQQEQEKKDQQQQQQEQENQNQQQQQQGQEQQEQN